MNEQTITLTTAQAWYVFLLVVILYALWRNSTRTVKRLNKNQANKSQNKAKLGYITESELPNWAQMISPFYRSVAYFEYGKPKNGGSFEITRYGGAMANVEALLQIYNDNAYGWFESDVYADGPAFTVDEYVTVEDGKTFYAVIAKHRKWTTGKKRANYVYTRCFITDNKRFAEAAFRLMRYTENQFERPTSSNTGFDLGFVNATIANADTNQTANIDYQFQPPIVNNADSVDSPVQSNVRFGDVVVGALTQMVTSLASVGKERRMKVAEKGAGWMKDVAVINHESQPSNTAPGANVWVNAEYGVDLNTKEHAIMNMKRPEGMGKGEWKKIRKDMVTRQAELRTQYNWQPSEEADADVFNQWQQYAPHNPVWHTDSETAYMAARTKKHMH